VALVRLWVLGSGSLGNAVLLEHGTSRILIDAGLSPRSICARLARIGIAPESILALLLTHEHQDHARGARVLARRFHWPIYATRGTHAELPDLRRARREIVTRGQPTQLAQLLIESWTVPHDAAEPCAYFITANDTGERAVIAFDLGYVSSGFAEACGHVDILVLESNHDEAMLRAGPYPPSVQRRIAGPFGHLSNRAAGILMRAAVKRRAQHVVLCHLSEVNNSPDVALGNARRVLKSAGFQGTVVAATQDVVCGPVGSAQFRLPFELYGRRV
jgi:phosphoribosyl 1,2-cyclic phosphodiesterase